MRLRRTILVSIILASALLSTGCARYWRNRGRDALNMMDLSITVNDTWKPQLGLYFDFFNLTPIGYSSLNCKEIGFGNRQIGWHDYQSECWGVLGYGHEKHGHGVFNPLDFEQARPDQRDLTERPMFTNGFGGAYSGDRRPPKIQFIECNRCIHIGYVGIQHTMRPAGILDFILGWTGLDLLGDDDLAVNGQPSTVNSQQSKVGSEAPAFQQGEAAPSEGVKAEEPTQ